MQSIDLGNFKPARLEYVGADAKVHLRLNRELRPWHWWLLPFGSVEREAARVAYMERAK